MTLDEAMRLCRLVRAFKDNLSHNASLLRRIVRSLDAAPPGYGALQESTLDFVEQALLDVMDANVALLNPIDPLWDAGLQSRVGLAVCLFVWDVCGERARMPLI